MHAPACPSLATGTSGGFITGCTSCFRLALVKPLFGHGCRREVMGVAARGLAKAAGDAETRHDLVLTGDQGRQDLAAARALFRLPLAGPNLQRRRWLEAATRT